MTSLYSLVRRFEDGDQRFRKLVQLYHSAIAVVRDNLVVSRPGARKLTRIRFDRLLARIDRWPACEGDIGESLPVLAEILDDYRSDEELVFAEEQQQLRRTVSSLTSLAETLRSQHRERGGELEAVATALEKALYEPNPNAIHSTLQKQILALKSTMVALSKASHEAANAISRDADGLLGITQTDAANGPNETNQLEKVKHALRDRIDHFEVFCVLTAELSGLDEIERAWGPPAREQLCVEYRKRIERSVANKQADQLWDGSRVIVINHTAAILANQRLNKMRVLLTQPYCVASPVGDAELRLPVRTGMIEYGGEGVEECMRRISESLSEHTLMTV